MPAKLPQSVETALDFAIDYITAYCIKQGVTAVLIFRDSNGNDLRRIMGDKGVSEIPESFRDATVLARLGMMQHASPADLLAIDAAITQAQANGERVMIL